MMVWFPFLCSFIISVGLIWIIRRLSFRFGFVVFPRDDRWHKKPTPTLGGVGIFLAFILALLIQLILDPQENPIRWGMLSGTLAVFIVGVYDDFRKISPAAKLVGQIIAAALVIAFGYHTNFFTPRIDNPVLAQLPNIILTFIWLIGITNAFNLLDNMDGLAAGIALITLSFLCFLFWQTNDVYLLVIALALGGGVLGFLIYNFPPASIFMGDSGSMFIGFTLALLAIARPPRASNVFAVIGVPALLFVLPILDTAFVTITRVIRGQSPVRGGMDHTSHRLVAFGFTEKQIFFILCGIALISGILAVGIEGLDYWLSLVLIPIFVITLALVTAYLGRVKLVSMTAPSKPGRLSNLMIDLAYRRHFLEVLLDFFLIGFAFYIANWIISGFRLDIDDLSLFLRSLPIVYVVSYLSLFYTGVYRGVWRYIGLGELLGYIKASLGGLIVLLVVNYALLNQAYSAMVFVLYSVILFALLAVSRSSFRVLDRIFVRQIKSIGEPILILGAGDSCEMAIRWIMMNPSLGYYPVGIIDQDRFNIGRQIHGVPILGTYDQFEAILIKKNIVGVVISEDANISPEMRSQIISACRADNRWVRTLKLEFEQVDT